MKDLQLLKRLTEIDDAFIEDAFLPGAVPVIPTKPRVPAHVLRLCGGLIAAIVAVSVLVAIAIPLLQEHTRVPDGEITADADTKNSGESEPDNGEGESLPLPETETETETEIEAETYDFNTVYFKETHTALANTGFSEDSFPSFKLFKFYQSREEADISTVNMDKDSLTITWNGQPLAINYVHTKRFFNNEGMISEEYHVYTDESESMRFQIREDGTLHYYKMIQGAEGESTTRLGASDAARIAKKFLSDWYGADFDPSDYTVLVHGETRYTATVVTFTRSSTYCGYKSNDTCKVKINTDGTVIEVGCASFLLYKEWDSIEESDVLVAKELFYQAMGENLFVSLMENPCLTVGADGRLYLVCGVLGETYNEDGMFDFNDPNCINYRFDCYIPIIP